MEMGGERLAMGYAPVAGTDWAIMTHEPVSSAFAVRQHISTGLLGLLVATILGLGAIGVVLGRGTIRSLEDLASKASDIESGNLDAELETGRELRRLAEGAGDEAPPPAEVVETWDRTVNPSKSG
jgi:methyl-accepting chemotaxis protein